MRFSIKKLFFVSLFLGLAGCSPTSLTKEQKRESFVKRGYVPIEEIAPKSDFLSAVDVFKKVCLDTDLDFNQVMKTAQTMGGVTKPVINPHVKKLEGHEITMPKGLPKIRIEQYVSTNKCMIFYASNDGLPAISSKITNDPDFSKFPPTKKHNLPPKYRYKATHLFFEASLGPIGVVINGKVLPAKGTMITLKAEKASEHTMKRLLAGLHI